MTKLSVQMLPTMTDVWQQTMNWQPTAEQQQLFQQLYDFILAGNSQLNLTRITEPEEFWEKHLWDSLRGVTPQKQVIPALVAGATVVDIGTGGGFPGVPVAIAFPNSRVTLLDSTRKKITFLQELGKALPLDNIKTVIGRAEEVGQNRLHRESYDVALIRAVGVASACAEYAVPMLKLGGVAVLYRGSWSEEDTTALQAAVDSLGGKVESVDTFATPLSDGVRNCVYVRKVGSTPAKYPRSIGVPTQQPL